ncbi:hypothetical protein [Cognatishimia sp. F0-27]|uniref:hypothetical protein n=1 Tax=Cognatishimia sp. F0-27 TaxID=2816855 RepID=UPI001D0CD7D2|nr:hypothetical protein [Cognatishimia sp. F0-27]MCC1494909.1 hypothetical protein [Cognatishimia sp. F0-27]
MKTGWTIAAVAAVVLVGAAAIYMIDIDQTEEAALPDVEMTVEGGNMPEFDAEVGSVSVGEEDVTVSVPDVDVDVTTEEETVSVPTLNVSPPEEDDQIAQN